MGQFERIRYPDGQISAKCLEKPPFFPETISERINSYEDLFYIRSIADCVSDPSKLDLFIPCMFGQRSDRRFSKMQSFDLKLICDIINECGFGKVEIFDPHSDVTMALIDKSIKKTSFVYVAQAVGDIRDRILRDDPHSGGGDLLLVSPDAGAYKKVFEYGEQLNLPVMGAMKHRDKDGKIDLMFTHDVSGKDCLIVDDMCDGGYTFNVLSKELRKQGARKVYLYVSHGLFSKGFKELAENIDHIYCTNSVKEISERELGREHGVFDFVTQYKVI